MGRARFTAAVASSLHLVSRESNGAPDPATAAGLLTHALLRPDATRADVDRACDEAVQHGLAAICVNGGHVSQAATRLRGSRVKVCVAVGFPLGAMMTNVKRFEAAEAMRLGAREVAMVLHLGALKAGDVDLVRSDVRGVAELVHNAGGKLTVILETPLLSHDQKALAVELAIVAGADAVQTTTGMAGSGTLEDVALLRRVAGKRAAVATDGAATAEEFAEQVRAGASRVITYDGAAMLRELGQKPAAAGA
jgi:deoxyribose-phosphate aldolase